MSSTTEAIVMDDFDVESDLGVIDYEVALEAGHGICDGAAGQS